MRGIGGDGDDRPAPLTAELRHRLLKQIKRAADVHRESLLPVLRAQLIGRPHAQDPGGIHQHVQSFDIVEQTRANVAYLVGIGDVEHFGGKRITFAVKGKVETGDVGPGLDESQRGGIANAFTCASHPHGLAVKIQRRHYFTSRESSAHQASMVGFFASITKSISPCTLRQRAASAIIRTESRP